MSDDCAHRQVGRYCPDCGKDLQPEPIDRRTILSELAENWWERGVLHSLIGLFRQPGLLIRRYIEEDRDLLVKPIAYAAVLLAVNYLIRARVLPGSDTTTIGLIEKLRNEPIILPLIIALVSSLVLHFIFYRRSPVGLFGTMVMRLYVVAQATLLMLFADLVMELVTPERSMERIAIRYALGLAFNIFAVRQFYAGEGRGSWIRAVAAVIGCELALILFIFTPLSVLDKAGLF